MKKSILFFTNLHPLPWQPARATYNFEEIRHLKAHADVKVLMPVPWFTYFKQVVINGHRSPEGFCLFPFFYIPKVLTSLHPLFLLLSLIICVKPLVWLAKSENVIASWAYAEAVVAALGKSVFKYKLIIECLGSDVNALMQQPLHKKQMRWAFKKSTAVTTKSKALAKVVKKHVPEVNPHVIYNGVDFDVFTLRDTTPFSSETQRLLFVGSLIPTKGVFELIEGFEKAMLNGQMMTLRIAGEGGSKEALQKLISAKSLEHAVTLLGAIPHQSLVNELHESDALILPSYREGVPNVIMEALATGTPVIATDVGGISEVLVPNLGGVLIAPQCTKSVTQALLSMNKFGWDRKLIKDSILKYTWHNAATRIMSLFR
ncbi:glycosyltransferase family 4 protein [Alteromonas sp. BL110]|uniref:glycosyltransferase n=1 Tax=Alteromonas sp. BL110 TaxID=1714845 RepID=UPI000E47DD02|nr:glycosyltransferase [Alteromonas sp. BL110]AXT39648.1 glycosyltransferase family 4 protein [Alteromonas sp. BL110]RKM81865.1 glycosyltransferase [Alteromonas sp. BL110]